jgi:hypothetical protein
MERNTYLGELVLWKVLPTSDVYKSVIEFLHASWQSTNVTKFPGPQPISIDRQHFVHFSREPYLACEKTDGTRHVLVCLMHGEKKIAALVNRSQEMHLIPMNFLRTMYQGSIMDGELVKDLEGRWRFMIYDCVFAEGRSLMNENLTTRISGAETFCNGIMKLAKDPLLIQVKNMCPLKEFKKLLNHEYPYKTDGYVFTPVNVPVRTGTHETMFKWKPRDSNTVDFLFSKRGDKWGLYVQEKGRLIFESELPLGQELAGTVEGSIVECQYVHWELPRWWRPVGLRTDKTHPNNRRTFYRTMANIAENIQPQEFSNL